MLKILTCPFEFLNVVLTQNIETIRDFGRSDQDASLEMIVKNLEKDVGEWHCLNSSDLSLLVEEEIKRLSDHMPRLTQSRNKHWKQSLRVEIPGG